MRKDIHPAYDKISVTCSCGETFKVGSALGHDMTIETCANCHPAYTGKHKATNTTGPVERFRSRYNIGKKDNTAAA